MLCCLVVSMEEAGLSLGTAVGVSTVLSVESSKSSSDPLPKSSSLNSPPLQAPLFLPPFVPRHA